MDWLLLNLLNLFNLCNLLNLLNLLNFLLLLRWLLFSFSWLVLLLMTDLRGFVALKILSLLTHFNLTRFLQILEICRCVHIYFNHPFIFSLHLNLHCLNNLNFNLLNNNSNWLLLLSLRRLLNLLNLGLFLLHFNFRLSLLIVSFRLSLLSLLTLSLSLIFRLAFFCVFLLNICLSLCGSGDFWLNVLPSDNIFLLSWSLLLFGFFLLLGLSKSGKSGGSLLRLFFFLIIEWSLIFIFFFFSFGFVFLSFGLNFTSLWFVFIFLSLGHCISYSFIK